MATDGWSPTEAAAAARRAMLGQFTTSQWMLIDQPRIDDFARVTNDDQYIHIDPVRAQHTMFGGTIAHGLLVLSLLPQMAAEGGAPPLDVAMGINYGFDKVRFVSPVHSGARVRARLQLAEVLVRGPGQLLLRHAATVEIEGQDKPALIADWLTVQMLKDETLQRIS